MEQEILILNYKDRLAFYLSALKQFLLLYLKEKIRSMFDAIMCIAMVKYYRIKATFQHLSKMQLSV